MNSTSLLNEGLLDKIFDLLRNRKLNKLRKAFKDQPKIQNDIKALNKYAQELEDDLKAMGIDHKVYRIK
jgi:hypothetical protein